MISGRIYLHGGEDIRGRSSILLEEVGQHAILATLRGVNDMHFSVVSSPVNCVLTR